MKEWKTGEIQWFSSEFEEGMLADIEDGEFYYLNRSACLQLKRLSKNGEYIKRVEFKTNNSKRSNQVSDVKLL